MASLFTHAFAGAALAVAGPSGGLPRRKLGIALGALAILPDVDVLGLYLGIPYAHPLGHRGLTHSPAFALLVGPAAAWILRDRARSGFPWSLAVLCALATASHGLLDALTDAGLGIGFLLPFHDERYFLPWRPLRASALSPGVALSERLHVLARELAWVWLPVLGALGAARLVRRAGRRTRRPRDGA